jgi:lipase chaperone LimK
LTRQEEPNRQVLVEKLINEFLREDVDSTLLASLERIGNAIDAEADKNALGEDWTLMQNYVQWCHERLRCPSEEM